MSSSVVSSSWRQALRPILPYYRHHGRAFVAGFLLLTLTNLSAAAIPYAIKLAIDAISAQPPQPVTLILLGLVGLALVNAWARIASRISIYRVGRQVEYDLRNTYHARLLELDAPFFQHQKTGDLVSRGTNDITAVRMFIGPGFLQLANAVMIYAVTVPVMVGLDPTLTVLALLPFPIAMLLARGLTRRLYTLSRAVADRFGILSGLVQETVSGMAVIRAHAREEHWRTRFEEESERLYIQHMAHARAQGLFTPLTSLSGGLGALMILAYGGERVIAGSMTVGDFAAFSGYLALLLWPTIGLGWIFTVMQRGLAALERLDTVLQARPSLTPPPDPPPPLPRWQGAIQVRDLRFSFDRLTGTPGTPRETLKGISLEIPPGSFVGLAGRVGSGKSALLGCLARLYPVSAGSILLDGRPLGEIGEAELRRNLALAPQESFLFSESVQENLLFGVPDGTPELAWEVARKASLHEEIAAFPKGMETVVGERGVTLSGGQRQRAALARALAMDPAILLLDDTFSSVDARTEAEILAQLRDYARGRTVVMVCQRLAALEHADRIYLMDQGTVVASGTHPELLETSPLYRELSAHMARSEALESLA